MPSAAAEAPCHPFAYKIPTTAVQEAGKAYGEIKDPRIEKANFVGKLLQSGQFNSSIAIDHQITDKGMLQAMNKYLFHSVIVSQDSSQETCAKNKLNNVEEVHQLLRQLTIVKHQMEVSAGGVMTPSRK
ncbi:uncharacterized protein VP01_3055g2 [Puccinia sorghi]|uniref:Uncharacterized protein n=1 Tax=Puccinia sorghi TaxID=27349 RepID=A0A0L6V1N9_9BASI|nr:uncharacterized protein VP01_3055g2 [Puccinia sorghi]